MVENRRINPLDQYSKPIREETTELSTIFWLNPRDSKKGRLFVPMFDERFPLKFPVKYVYVSEFLVKDNASGNHFHRVKQEILIPLDGAFEIYLEDTRTKIRETLLLTAKEKKAVYVRTGIAHRVVSKEDTGVLLVLTSNHSTLEDEIEYTVA